MGSRSSFSAPTKLVPLSDISVLAHSKHVCYVYSTNEDDGALQLGTLFRASDSVSKVVAPLQERGLSVGGRLLSSILLIRRHRR